MSTELKQEPLNKKKQGRPKLADFNINEMIKDKNLFISDMIEVMKKHGLSPIAVISVNDIKYLGDNWPGIKIAVATDSIKQTVSDFSKSIGAQVGHHL